MGDEPAADYVELAVRFPEVSNSMLQFFGAHAACFDRVNAHGYRLERPLHDPDDDLGEDDRDLGGAGAPDAERTTDPVPGASPTAPS